MKFTVAKKELLRVLDLAAGAIADIPLTPALKGVCLTASRKDIRVEATNNEVALIAAADGKVERPGTLLIDAKWLRDATRGVEDDVTLDVKELRFTMTSGAAVYRGACLDPAEFPTLNADATKDGVVMPARTLARMLKATAFAANDPKERPELACVCLSGDGDGMTAMAADGHRLARASFEGGNGLPQILIPSSRIDLLVRVLDGAADDAMATVSKVHGAARVEVPGVTVSAQEVAAAYPNLTSVIPTEDRWTGTVLVEGSGLLAALRRMKSVGATGKDNCAQVDLDVKADRIDLTATGPNGDAAESVEAEYDGAPMVVRAATDYVIDAIAAVGGDEAAVELRVIDPESVVMVREAGATDRMCLVMPMRIL